MMTCAVRLAEKSEEKSEDMKVDTTDATKNSEGKEAEGKESEVKTTKKKRVPEPTSFTLLNPSRATPEQEQYLSFNLDQRYAPVNPRSKPCGIIVLVDRTPDEDQDVVQVRPREASQLSNTRMPHLSFFSWSQKVELPGSDSEKDEAKPPDPFEWSPDMQ